MEMLLALVVFGVLGAITIYGYLSSERSARERERGDYSQNRPMSGTSSQQ